MTRIDNANPTNQRMIHSTEPKGSDTKGAVLPLNEDRAYPIPKASAPPERRLFLVALPASSRTPHSRAHKNRRCLLRLPLPPCVSRLRQSHLYDHGLALVRLPLCCRSRLPPAGSRSLCQRRSRWFVARPVLLNRLARRKACNRAS